MSNFIVGSGVADLGPRETSLLHRIVQQADHGKPMVVLQRGVLAHAKRKADERLPEPVDVSLVDVDGQAPSHIDIQL